MCRSRPRGDESRNLNETCGKGKGKGDGGKGEHASKGGGFGGKGAARMTKADDEKDERVQVAPDMGAGGSYSQATLDPEEGEVEEEKKGTRRLRWADCDDNEEEGRQEVAEEKWHKARKEQRIVKQIDCSDEEQEWQEKAAVEEEERERGAKRREEQQKKCEEKTRKKK